MAETYSMVQFTNFGTWREGGQQFQYICLGKGWKTLLAQYAE